MPQPGQQGAAAAPGAAVAPAAGSAGQTALPDLTIPQIFAFVTFLVVVVLALINIKTVTGPEFAQVRKLAIFLIGALLPSDAVIRFGRSLFLKAATSAAGALAPGAAKAGGNKPAPTADTAAKEFRPATLAQILAFATFLVVALLTVTGSSIEDPKGKDVVKVAVFLIAALLPSEAGIRFGRSLYLRNASNVTTAHLKKI